MESKAIECVIVSQMPPEGEYNGFWGGYRVRFDVDGSEYECKMRDGIRTPAARCTVRVKNGSITAKIK
jgi:hypothetical protein